NILVFSSVPTAPHHQAAIDQLSDFQTAGAELWISRQILREFLATLSRPQTWALPVPMSRLLTITEAFERDLRVAEDGPAVTAQLRTLLANVACGGKQVHDANVIATMLAHGIPKLFTDNVADFTRFAAYIAV